MTDEFRTRREREHLLLHAATPVERRRRSREEASARDVFRQIPGLLDRVARRVAAVDHQRRNGDEPQQRTDVDRRGVAEHGRGRARSGAHPFEASEELEVVAEVRAAVRHDLTGAPPVVEELCRRLELLGGLAELVAVSARPPFWPALTSTSLSTRCRMLCRVDHPRPGRRRPRRRHTPVRRRPRRGRRARRRCDRRGCPASTRRSCRTSRSRGGRA